jgi:4-hydroxy-tetrahydrodipicolinate synthase
MRMQYRLLELFDAMLYAVDFPEGVRAAVELRGFCPGHSRQPQTDRQRVDRAVLQNTLRPILAEFGYVDPTDQECPPQGGVL